MPTATTPSEPFAPPLEVIDAVRALSADTQRDFGEKLAVRIAIHRGQIYRDLESVYGLTTNVTARLQQLAPPDGIVISDDVQRMIGDVFETASMGPHLVKGVEEPIHAHQVIGERSGHLGSDPSSARPFIDRVSEWERLQTVWDEVCHRPDGPPVRPCLLRGEAGVGKSYLASRVTARAGDGHGAGRRAGRIGLLRRLGSPPGAETHRTGVGRS